MPIVILAHGNLGSSDEIIFISIAIVFIGIMAVSWFRSQQLPDKEVDGASDNTIREHQQPDTEHFDLN